MNRTEFEKEYLTGINYLSFDDKFDKYIRDTSVGSNVDSLATMYATMARVNIQYHVWNFRQPEITALQEENARLKKWKLVAENYIEWLPKPFLHAISYVTNQEFIDKLKEEEEG